MKKEERREKILAVARKVFSQRGYHATSISEIIARAGIARGTFYLYFHNKRAIFDELLEILLRLLDSAIRRIDLGDKTHSALEQMYDNIERVMTILLNNRELARILLKEAVGQDKGFDRKLDIFYQRIIEMIENSLKLGMDMGLVRPCNTKIVAFCILGSIKELIYRLTISQDLIVDRAGLVKELLDYNLKGLFFSQ